jgi:formate hydrogenlyase transcriptional activator
MDRTNRQVGDDEDLMPTFLASFPGIIAVLDSSGLIRRVNQDWIKFAQANGGDSPRASMGVNYFDVCRRAQAEGAEGAAEALAGVEGVIQGRQTEFTLQFRCDSPSQKRWFVLRARRHAAEGGGAVLSYQDITAFKANEEALQQSELRLDLVAAAAGAGLWVLDTGTGKFWASDQARKIYGFTPSEELTMAALMRVVHPEDRERVRSVTEQALASVEPSEIEYRLVGSDGSVRWVYARGRPEMDSAGRPVRLMGASTDITKRKLEQEAMRLSEEQFRQVFDSSVEGLALYEVVYDPAGKVVDWILLRTNRTGVRGLPFLSESAYGKRATELFGAEVMREYIAASQEVMDSGQGQKPYETYFAPSGDYFLAWNAPIGKRYLITAGLDITERKRSEEALRRSEERLRLAIEATELGTFDVDLVTGAVQDSVIHRRHFGLPASGELDRQSFWQAVHPDDRERMEGVMAQITRPENGGRYQAEYRTRGLKDGQERWIAANGRIFFDEQGKAVRMLGVTHDVTEQKRAEQKLRSALAEVEELKERLQEENVYLRQTVKVLHGHSRLVGNSAALMRSLGQVEQVAPTQSTVLLQGETGSGKEVLATAIHELSPRRERSMVCVNCASIPGSLIESELFGREKGAYTGALTRQIGSFELAQGSTLFLDEVGELPMEAQAKLLRVLETRQIQRLGNPKPIPVDVRIVAATNKSLDAAIREEKFRKDLYYRLNVFPIAVPPLRERTEDIPLLVWAFVEEFGKTFHKKIESISRRNMEALQAYAWPGNVRELRNVVERAMILATGPGLQIELPGVDSESAVPLARGMREVEKQHILQVVKQTNWRIRGKAGAAEILGLKPTTLETRMAKLGIKRPKKNSGSR